MMSKYLKILYLWLPCLLLCSCGTKSSHPVCASNLSSCERSTIDSQSDTMYNDQLMQIAEHFESHHVDLDASIKEDTLFSQFIDEVGVNTIRKQSEYDTFLLIVFLKLYQHHLSCYHQGYDLKAMRKGYATFLIDDLCALMDIDILHREMLNDGCVVDFVASNESYLRNAYIAQIVDSINSIDVLQYF